MKKTTILTYFLRLIKLIANQFFAAFLLLCSFSVFSGFMAAVSVWVWKLLFDVSGEMAVSAKALHRFCMACVFLFLVFFLEYILSILRSRIVAKVEESVRIRLLERLYIDIQRIPADRFTGGDLYDTISRIHGFFSGNRFTLLIKRIFLIIQSAVTCISVSTVLVSYHPGLLILCLVSILPPAIFRIIRGKRYYYLAKYQTPEKRTLAYYYSLLTTPASLKELRIYNACGWIEKKRNTLRDKLSQEERIFLRKNGLIQFCVDFCRTLGIGLGIAATGFLVILEKVSLGTFASSISAFQNVQRAFSTILITFGLIDQDLLSFQEFWELEENLPPARTHCEGKPFSFRDSICFQNVGYRYPGEESYALHDVNVEIKQGECVAVFGLNGAGKSTFTKLLMGLYMPAEGKILVDGTPLTQYPPEEIQENITAVFQDFVRYKLTIRDSIAVGCLPEAENTEKMDKVISQSGVADFLYHLENGLDTQLGTEFGGIDLSGGQWQRIALARAMLKNVPILVMDEPTSAIDPLEENTILHKMKEMTREKTAIIVSHRVSLSKIADKILIFKDGTIVEEGSHMALLEKKGEYYNMYTQQVDTYT